MAKRLNLTENYVAYCAHGGVVKPKGTSSTPHVKSADIPYVNIQDLPGTPIVDCPARNPCKVVANFTTASAEMNIQSSKVNPAVDLVGIKSDKGATISLSYAGQSNVGTCSLHESDSSVEGGNPTILEEKKALQNKEKEKYNLYLIRESKNAFLEKVFKPIRASRGFQKMEEYYAFDINCADPIISDKIITYTLAFIYIELANGKIDEYRILNKGSVLGGRLKDIRYKDENNIEHKYIPLYDDNKIKIYYTNVQLRKEQSKRKDDIKNFEPFFFTPNKLENDDFYIKEVDSLNINEINEEKIKTEKKYDPKKYNAKYPYDVIVNIKDPIGQIEDMYNIFEFKYKNNYSFNNKYIQDIKKRNSYVFTIANQIDYLYVKEDEQKIYDEHINKLKKLYTKLANAVLKSSITSLIIKDVDNIKPLDEIINPNFDIAVNYFNEVSSVNKSFFKELEKVEDCDEDYFEMYANNIYCRYYGLVDYRYVHEQNIYKKRRLKSDRGFFEELIEDLNNLNAIYLVLSDSNDKKYYPYRKKPYEILALLVFSICFSNKYEDFLNKEGLKQTVEEFYYALKNSPKLPAIDDKSIEEIREIVKNQKTTYNSILSRENKLLEQYKNIEDLNKQYSYDIDSARALNPKNELNDLYVQDDYKTFVYEDGAVTAKKVHEAILSLVSEENNDLIKQIEAHQNIKEFENDLTQKTYLNTMINLCYFFIANRTKLDYEANLNSPFKTENLHIYNLIVDITKRRLKLEESLAMQIDELPINEFYSQTILAHTVHSLVKTDKNKDGFDLRKTKVTQFLEELNKLVKSENSTYEIDVLNLLDTNYEASLQEKTKIEKLSDIFLAATGVESKFRDMVKEGFDDMGSDENRKEPNLKITKLYKKYMTLSKSLASFVTVINLGNYTLGKKVLKTEDIFPLIESSGKLVGFVGELLPKTKASIIEQTQKILSLKNLEKIKKFDVLAKVGMVSIVVSTWYELKKIDETDIDGQVAVLMKNTLELSLMMIPLFVTVPYIGWVAAAITLGIHIAWEFYLKDMFIDSAIETYLLKSLLFNHKEQPSKFEYIKYVSPQYALYCKIYSLFDSDIAYNTLYLKEAANKEKEIIKGFTSFKELQTFLGKNYDLYKDEFEEALKYELTNLKVSLYGYNVEIEDKIVTTIPNIPYNLSLKTQIKIPKETLLNNIEVVLKTNNYTKTIRSSEILQHNQMPKETLDFFYDTVKNTNLKAYLNQSINKKMFENIYLFIINRDISLKYKIDYVVRNISNPHRRGKQYNKIKVEIKKIKLTPLLEEDESLVNSIIERRKLEEGIK